MSEKPTEPDALEPPDPKRYGPGTFGCHEAMHEASLLMKWAYELSEHSAVKLNPEWETAAVQIGDKLFDLYQKIALAHLDAPDRPEGGSHGKESLRQDR